MDDLVERAKMLLGKEVYRIASGKGSTYQVVEVEHSGADYVVLKPTHKGGRLTRKYLGHFFFDYAECEEGA